jgi:glycosyltransferase involved in cell wall biosynthesis
LQIKERRKVVIVQSMSKLYREPLFLKLHEELAKHEIELRVVYSDPPSQEQKRHDDIDLPPNIGHKCGRWLFSERLLVQPCFGEYCSADLIVVEHALKYALNPIFLLLSLLGIKKLGVWVHGGSLRFGGTRPSFLIRKWGAIWPDWRFAYTEGVAEELRALGANSTSITVLRNAIDLTEFRIALESVSEDELSSVRQSLGIPDTARVALFCGSLYATKGVDFVIKACDEIRRSDPVFHLIVVGGGADQDRVIEAAKTRQWLHYRGAVHGSDRAPLFKLADLALMPYLTGLGILDAMAAGLPYIVTSARATNPEIDYLIEGETGLRTGDDTFAYAAAVSSILADPPRLERMAEASRRASLQYSIEDMVSNFSEGIRGCLASHSGHSR